LLAEDWEILSKLRSAGLDWPEERFEWVLATHLCLGGLVIEPDGGTELPGLYAAGEAATGVHGANRLSGNAFSDCLVFGIRAGRAAALHALSAGPVEPLGEQVAAFESEMQDMGSGGGPEPGQWQQAVRQAAWQGLGVVRSAEGLKAARDALGVLSAEQPRCTTRRDLITALETRNLMLTAQLIAHAALLRTESRGQHLRQDYPDLQDEWRKWVVLRHTTVDDAADLSSPAGGILATVEPIGGE
jgi:fumarate reductase (CoM/CoB) subunit A